MTGFVLRRAGQAVVIIFAVVSITFFVVRLAPGDPFANTAEHPLPQSFLDEHRARWGLDEPLWAQYVTFLRNLLQGDLGRSFHSNQPVVDQLAGAFVNTLILGLAAIVVNFGVGITLGVWQALRRGSRFDRVTSAMSLVLLSIPMYWLGFLAAHWLGTRLGLFPAYAAYDSLVYDQLSWIGKVFHRLHHLALPAAVLGLTSAAWTARYMRAQTIDASNQPHVRTARAKGLPDRVVLIRHIARNALVPIVTLFGLYLPALLSGAVFIEYVFVWRGLGWEAAQAVETNDYPILAGTAIITATLVVFGSALADALYRLVDPRVGTR